MYVQTTATTKFQGYDATPSCAEPKNGDMGGRGQRSQKMITSFMDDPKLKQDDEHNIVISINWPPFTMTNEY